MAVTRAETIQALRWAKTMARCEVIAAMKPGRARREFARRVERYEEVLTALLERVQATPDTE